jgi:methyl halide transferase
MTEDKSTPEFWENRYLSGETRWDLGGPSPPFVSLLAGPDAPPPGRMAVLGCGRGHDALLFARAGHDVVGFDFASSAVESARALAASAGANARFERRDIFTLPGEHAGAFDSVLEYTCFCAIDPSRRREYVEVVSGLLRPGGLLVALFYPFEVRDDSPPFPVTEPEIRSIFGTDFKVKTWRTPVDSIERRAGNERLVILER